MFPLSLITGLLGTGGSALSKYLLIGMAVVIFVGGGIGYWYYKDSQATIQMLNSDIATYEANQVTLEGAIQEQNESIIRLEDTRKLDQQKINTLSQSYGRARGKVNDLRKLLSKHDLGYLAQEKPGLIERRINSGTKGIGAEFERLSQPEEQP